MLGKAVQDRRHSLTQLGVVFDPDHTGRAVLHAQTYARSLYEGAGYHPRGRVFMESGIEHIAMEKLL